MDEEVKALLREALDLYKRDLDMAAATRDRQLALMEANSQRNWRWWLRWMALAFMVAVIMAIGFPLVDWFLHRQ